MGNKAVARNHTSDQLKFYDDNLGRYNRLKDETLYALERGLDFKVHGVLGRVKERQSVSDKILRKSYGAPEAELEDLVGLRIVCLYTSDLDKADKVIRDTFDVVSFEDKINDTSEDSFGYMSVHYICQLREENNGARYDGLHGLKFEVQCRTILMDAWANVSHHLAYKGKNSLPDVKKRAFHALAGLFYVADEQFQQMLHASAQTEPVRRDGSLDRDSVRSLLKDLYPDRDAELEALDKDLDLLAVSEFVEEASSAGYGTLQELRDDLVKFHDQALEWERENPPMGDPSERFFRVGIARAALDLGNPRFKGARKRKKDEFKAE